MDALQEVKKISHFIFDKDINQYHNYFNQHFLDNQQPEHCSYPHHHIHYSNVMS